MQGRTLTMLRLILEKPDLADVVPWPKTALFGFLGYFLENRLFPALQ
jgi:hypothetical protein